MAMHAQDTRHITLVINIIKKKGDQLRKTKQGTFRKNAQEN